MPLCSMVSSQATTPFHMISSHRLVLNHLQRSQRQGRNRTKLIEHDSSATVWPQSSGVNLVSEDLQRTGMGMITQPQWWSAQAQGRGGLLGRECFGHQFLR